MRIVNRETAPMNTATKQPDPFGFDALEDLGQFERAARSTFHAQPAADDRPRYPCERCGGSGRYTFGYVNRQTGPCHACKGVGSFAQPKEHRMAARAKTAARKAGKLEAAQAEFNAAQPGLIAFLRESAGWSEFARALVEGFDRYGSLTDRQTESATRMRAKLAAKQADKAAAREAGKVAVDLTAITALFAKATGAGLKAPTFLAEGLALDLAKPHSRNAGAIYVKDDQTGEYLGKVVEGHFLPQRAATEAHKAALAVIAAQPAEAAVRYGKLTKRCSCCGKRLTDPVSVERGIGPICAANWGL